MNTPCQCQGELEFDPQQIDEIVARIGRTPDKVIAILQEVQKLYAYIPQEAIDHIADTTEISRSRLVGVSTFYNHFRLQPAGKHTIRVCVGTACHVKGAPQVLDSFRRFLGLAKDEDTDADRLFTIQPVACLGCCTLAPVVVIDDVTYGHVTPDGAADTVRDFLASEKSRAARPPANDTPPLEGTEIRIGLGSCCVAGGAAHVRDALEQALHDLAVNVKVKRVGCVGMCHNTPLVEIVKPDQQPHLYAKVKPEDAARIIQRHFETQSVGRKLSASIRNAIDNLLTDETWEPVTRYSIDVRDKPVAAFIGQQKHIALEHCGHIDPTDLDEYRRRGGFEALKKCLTEIEPEAVVEEVIASGLRGRGGAGFTTGHKWRFVRQAEGDEKYIILNGDEGDPGAFMDRMLLESYPYRILEGMAIAAYAVGARQGVLYIREEYPLAVLRMREAIERCEKAEYLGPKMFGSDFSLSLRIMEGAGAFVCGEETALIASIEGRRGMPRMRPPFPAQSGLHGKPTLVNNVESYANLAWIFNNGAGAYAELGTQSSRGTKVFALAGKIQRGGLIEVPMGITINEIVHEIGGGVAEGRSFKAVQIGGPSGGCIPSSLGRTPVDFENLNELGAIMGSGGLVVLDDKDCMVDVSRYFMSFTQSESCGKCTMCRVGTRRMLEILNRLCKGEGKTGDIENLEDLGKKIKQGSLCGLGKTAPNPVLSTLRHFREEYEAHIEGRCPAGKCQALIRYTVNDKCIGCTKCAQACPAGAIRMRPYERHEVNQDLCTKCDGCRQACPVDAIDVS